MSCNVVDDTYVSQGGKVPVKWTAPEVYKTKKNNKHYYSFNKYEMFL